MFDFDSEKALFSPATLDEYVGKIEKVKILKRNIELSKKSEKPLDHILITGPSGVGKSILFELIAKELGVPPSNIRRTTGVEIKNSKNLVTLLQSLEDFGLVFIDEIHGLKRECSEPIYSALDEGIIHLAGVSNSRVKLPKFTLIGASSERGEIPTALERRFNTQIPIDFYNDEELKKVLDLLISKTKLELSAEEQYWLINNSRGTPGELTKFIKKIYYYREKEDDISIQDILAENDIEYGYGMTTADWRYLEFLDESQNSEEKDSKGVGISIIVSAIGLTELGIKLKVEPYLIFKNFIKVNKQGRTITDKGRKLLEGYRDWKYQKKEDEIKNDEESGNIKENISKSEDKKHLKS